jgi:tight adherence protein C
MRPVRLADRLAPYLGALHPGETVQSRLLGAPTAGSAPFTLVRRLFGPLLGELVGLLDRTVGGTTSVRRRLDGLGSDLSVEEFRVEQVVWAAIGMLGAGLGMLGLQWLSGQPNPVLAGVAAIAGLVAGVLARDWWLSRQLAEREQRMLAEFPVAADLLALAVIAGEAPTDALQRLCRLLGGELARDLGAALARARAGTPLTSALGELAERTTLEPFARFVQGLIVAIERGTPLADVLRAQALDVRELGKRSLLEAGGRKEIAMLVPVVFLLLPVTVLFALYPGLLTLTTLAR